jgi:hypothetical protein
MYNRTKPNYNAPSDTLGYGATPKSSTGETSSSTYVTSNSGYGVFNSHKNEAKTINQVSYYSPTRLKEEQPASISTIPVPRNYTSNQINTNPSYGRSQRYTNSDYPINTHVRSIFIL